LWKRGKGHKGGEEGRGTRDETKPQAKIQKGKSPAAGISPPPACFWALGNVSFTAPAFFALFAGPEAAAGPAPKAESAYWLFLHFLHWPRKNCFGELEPGSLNRSLTAFFQ
jgi:hypothetical protein